MDKQRLEKYRRIIIDILEYYSKLPAIQANNVEIEEQLLVDTKHDHYQILTIGWEGGKRVYYPIFHIDIKKDKVWVQEDATDFDLVEQLENRGIDKSDIVLAFHAPYDRHLTGYAVA